MIYQEKPKNFDASFQVSAVYCFFDGKMLILKRANHKKSEPGKWGVPAGKIEHGEDKVSCAMREMKEETDVDLSPEKLSFVKEVHVVWDEAHFSFNIFRYEFDELPEISINYESSEYQWISSDEIDLYDLVRDERECIVFANGY